MQDEDIIHNLFKSIININEINNNNKNIDNMKVWKLHSKSGTKELDLLTKMLDDLDKKLMDKPIMDWCYATHVMAFTF